MLWQKATSTYIHTAVNSPSAESASGMHSAHKASAVWKTADKIILLFDLLWKVRFGFEGQLSRAFQLVSSKANGRTLVLSHTSLRSRIQDNWEGSLQGWVSEYAVFSPLQCGAMFNATKTPTFQHGSAPCLVCPVSSLLVLALIVWPSWWFGENLFISALIE